jgi:hypothetical protein
MSLHRVRYVGLSDVRSMSKAELGAAGVSLSGGLKWERRNGWLQVIKDPSDRLLEILAEEGTFTVEETDEKGVPNGMKILEGAPLDDTGGTVVDDTTGQVSVKGEGETEVQPGSAAKAR